MQQLTDRFNASKKTLTYFDLYNITLSEMLEKVKLLESEKYENYVEHIIAEVEALATLYKKVSGEIETKEFTHLKKVVETLHQGKFTGARLVIEEGKLNDSELADTVENKIIKALLIKECTDSRWYASKIGQAVPFLGDVGDEYKSIDDGGFVNFVQYKDCEIVEVEAPNLISDCGCRFKNSSSNDVLLCDECSTLPCHNL